VRVGRKAKDALRSYRDWLTGFGRLVPILVIADLPRGDRGGVLDEYLYGLKIYDQSRGQLQTLSMQLRSVPSLATCINSP
jgi:hypothetical protein